MSACMLVVTGGGTVSTQSQCAVYPLVRLMRFVMHRDAYSSTLEIYPFILVCWAHITSISLL